MVGFVMPKLGKCWEASRHFCISWTHIKALEEAMQRGEAGCCNSQEKECGWRWTNLEGSLEEPRSLFSPRE